MKASRTEMASAPPTVRAWEIYVPSFGRGDGWWVRFVVPCDWQRRGTPVFPGPHIPG